MVLWIFNRGRGREQGALATMHPPVAIPEHAGLGVYTQCSRSAHVPTPGPGHGLARVLTDTGVCVHVCVSAASPATHTPTGLLRIHTRQMPLTRLS